MRLSTAGETSIAQTRLQQQNNNSQQTLDELDRVIDRLQDQIRRLNEDRTSFFQQAADDYEEFDTLEMDRYSHMQQLARSV